MQLPRLGKAGSGHGNLQKTVIPKLQTKRREDGPSQVESVPGRGKSECKNPESEAWCFVVSRSALGSLGDSKLGDSQFLQPQVA